MDVCHPATGSGRMGSTGRAIRDGGTFEGFIFEGFIFEGEAPPLQ